ncbi:MAG TPA: succinate dehydrogenase, cytochrome b556 subunit [Steroidobacteraceae bacterium]|nr:succinate dehydrogenase, cytochrome b556 subunit [Steroidobacteraceae bacterium]
MMTRERPLSPFMQYRWQYTNTLSILHRITGVFMTLGLVLFVYWLAALAAGASDYATALDRLSSVPAMIALFAWSFAFFYHLLNGIRHLFWDTGRGLERAAARRSGWGVVAGSVIATLAVWLILMTRFAGGAA